MQSGSAVFGVQGDFAGLDLKGSAPCVVFLSCTSKSDWLATVSGRIGGVVADRALIYAKGGAAWMNSTHSLNVSGLGGFGGFPGGGALAGQLTSQESTSWGWLVGMGAEYMITQNWSAFIEYNYIATRRTNPSTSTPGRVSPIYAAPISGRLPSKCGITLSGAF